MELVRTALDTWAWTDDDGVIGGTAYQNPKHSMEAGLELVEGALRDGEMDPDEARRIVASAREVLAEVEAQGEAHRAAAEAARAFLTGLRDPGEEA